jgi:hypothetical protein
MKCEKGSRGVRKGGDEQARGSRTRLKPKNEIETSRVDEGKGSEIRRDRMKENLRRENLERNLRQTEISRTTGEHRILGWLEMYICEPYLSTFEPGNLKRKRVENGGMSK